MNEFFCGSCQTHRPESDFVKTNLIKTGDTTTPRNICKRCDRMSKPGNTDAIEFALADYEGEKEEEIAEYGNCEVQNCCNFDLVVFMDGKHRCPECAVAWEGVKNYRPKPPEEKRPDIPLEERERFIAEFHQKLVSGSPNA